MEFAHKGRVCSSITRARPMRPSEPRLEIEALGVRGIAVQADVSDDAACRALVATAVKEFGRVDVLVNNAGTTRFVQAVDLEAVKDEDWQRLFAVNVIGAVPLRSRRQRADARLRWRTDHQHHERGGVCRARQFHSLLRIESGA